MIAKAISKNNPDAWVLMKQFVRRYVTVTDSEIAAWEPYFELRKFDKKQVITSVGDQEEYINIVVHGLARKYAKLKNGEVTMQIAPEGHMIHAEFSYHMRKPSNLIVETIEPTTFIAISYKKMNELFDSYPKAEHMGRLFVTEMFIIKDRRYIDMVKKSTREIFLEYMESHAHMLQRVRFHILEEYFAS